MRKSQTLKDLVSRTLLLLTAILFLYPTPLWADKTVPEFQLQSLNNTELIRSQDYQGKVMLVNFWATWCPPCRQEIPSLIKLQKQYKEQGFTVIGISVDQSAVTVIKKFVDKMEINYPVAVGTMEVAKEFGSNAGIPASYLIDRQGRISKRYAGYVTYEQLNKDIEGTINL